MVGIVSIFDSIWKRLTKYVYNDLEKRTQQYPFPSDYFRNERTVAGVSFTDDLGLADGVRRKANIKLTWAKYPYGRMRMDCDYDSLRVLSKSIWVQRCLTLIKDVVCSQPWEIISKSETDKHEELIKTQTDFLKNPSTDETQNFRAILRQWVDDVLCTDASVTIKNFTQGSFLEDELTGQYLFDVETPIGNLKEIQVFDPQLFLKDVNDNGVLLGYWQYNYQQKRPVFFQDREVIWQEKNPRSWDFYGYAPLQSVEDIVKLMIASTVTARDFFAKGAIPRGIITADMGPDELTAFQAYWKNEIMGNPHKFPVMKGGADVKFIPFNPSMKDVFFLDELDWYARAVMSAFQVPPHELGYTDSTNKASAEQQSAVFKRILVRPLLDLFQDAYNREILPEFDDKELTEFRFIIEPDVEELNKEQDFISSQIGLGQMTPNDWRRKRGLKEYPWGEVPPEFWKSGIYTIEQFDHQVEESMKPPEEQMPQEEDGVPQEEEQAPSENEESPKTENEKSNQKTTEEKEKSEVKEKSVGLSKMTMSEKDYFTTLDLFEKRGRKLRKNLTILELDLEKGIKTYFANVIRYTTTIDEHYFFGKEADDISDFLTDMMNEEDLTKELHECIQDAYIYGLKSIEEEIKEEKGIGQNIKYIMHYGRIVAKRIIKQIKETVRFKTFDLLSKDVPIKKVLTEHRRILTEFAKKTAPLTASHAVYTAFNLGRINKLQSIGQTHWIYYTMEDERVCKECMPHHGKRYTFKNLVWKPPLHPNCRCFVKAIERPLTFYFAEQQLIEDLKGIRPTPELITPLMAKLELTHKKSITEILSERLEKKLSVRKIADQLDTSHVSILNLIKACELSTKPNESVDSLDHDSDKMKSDS